MSFLLITATRACAFLNFPEGSGAAVQANPMVEPAFQAAVIRPSTLCRKSRPSGPMAEYWPRRPPTHGVMLTTCWFTLDEDSSHA